LSGAPLRELRKSNYASASSQRSQTLPNARAAINTQRHTRMTESAMSMQKIKHVVVVMFESRSFDTMLGGLYADGSFPQHFLPASSHPFDGLIPGLSNPSNMGAPIPASMPASSATVPDPDPQESFEDVRAQLFGDAHGATPMSGFVLNYERTVTTDASQVMQCHSPEQLQVLSTLARSYAVSDAWFASVPSQTWPNRAFAHAGTSNGHVNNGCPPDPFAWHIRTIFNVLEDVDVSWAVYSDEIDAPSLTLTMFPTLWDAKYEPNFQHFGDFVTACQSNTLPQYSFIEPRFLLDPNDQHPPHDVNAGERFLYDIWTALSTSPAWQGTLLVVTYGQHGGTFDHVLPPFNAEPPDAVSSPGDESFSFDRFGVRVPAVVVSPYIAAGTVFRSPSMTPYDHTSILATLRDWLAIAPANMLASMRVAAAPTLAPLLTLDAPRTDLPAISAPPARGFIATSLVRPLNDVQQSLVSGAARRFGLDPVATLQAMPTRQHALDFLRRLLGKGDGNAPPGIAPTREPGGEATMTDSEGGIIEPVQWGGQMPGFFTTSVFLHPALPELAIITVPSTNSDFKAQHPFRASSGGVPNDDVLALMGAAGLIDGDGVFDWGVSVDIRQPNYEVSQREVEIEICKSLLGVTGDIAFGDALGRQAFPVMHSPIAGTTLAQLFAHSGSGAAFLAAFPHPDAGQIATYFLVIGGTKIVIGAADGIALALKHGLSYLLLKWMGAPTEIIAAEAQRATKRRGGKKARTEKKGGRGKTEAGGENDTRRESMPPTTSKADDDGV
jgi:phospholipase C